MINFEQSELSSIKVQVARTESERSLGLMYRKKLALDQGMLFVFPIEEERSFWMKNTFIPLDMLFIDKDGIVKKIITNVPPHTTTQRRSEHPVKYVLELNAELANKLGIKEGSKLNITACVP